MTHPVAAPGHSLKGPGTVWRQAAADCFRLVVKTCTDGRQRNSLVFPELEYWNFFTQEGIKDKYRIQEIIKPLQVCGQMQQYQTNPKNPIFLFKASALWADASYKSKCPCVCLFVCVCVCPSHFLTPFDGLIAPLPKVQCPNFLDIRNPWGKVM